MSIARSHPGHRLSWRRPQPAKSWRAGLLGDADGNIRIGDCEYVWVRLGNATDYRLIVAYLDRRAATQTTLDDLLPVAGTTVFVEQEAGIWKVIADQFTAA